MLTRTHVMIHHSFTADGRTSDWPAIRTFHTSYRRFGDIITEQGYYAMKAQHIVGLEKPWLDIGYHAGVEMVDTNGRVEAFLGRDWSTPAAACPQGNMNQVGLHVCVIGNYDLVAPSPEHLRVLVKNVIRPWMNLFNISADHIVGHRDYNPAKSCPGTMFDLNVVKSMVT